MLVRFLFVRNHKKTYETWRFEEFIEKKNNSRIKKNYATKTKIRYAIKVKIKASFTCGLSLSCLLLETTGKAGWDGYASDVGWSGTATKDWVDVPSREV